MNAKMNVPELRFKEFSGEWEEKSLNKISKINPRTKELPNEFVYIDLESVEKGILVKSNVISKEKAPSRAQRVLDRNDILFQTVRPYQKNNYYFQLNGDYVASTGYAQIKAKDSSEFLYQKLHTEKFVNDVLVRCTGTSYPAISSTDLSTIKVKIPSLPEQEKIASFLSSVDTKIEQLTKKKTLLEQYKKGVMQKIFSQEIRFRDDDGGEYPGWVEKKLGGFMIQRNTQAPKSDEYPLMAFVANKGVTHKGDRYNREFLVTDGDNKKYKQTELGDFIYSSNNLETGSIGLNNYGSASISPVYSIFKIKELCNYQFISSFLTRKAFISKMIRYRQGVVYGQWRIHESDFLQIQEKLPSLPEQTKIANFLTSIDSKISQTGQQLEGAKQFKKALLQKMFV